MQPAFLSRNVLAIESPASMGHVGSNAYRSVEHLLATSAGGPCAGRHPMPLEALFSFVSGLDDTLHMEFGNEGAVA
jgi:hypothetical protein